MKVPWEQRSHLYRPLLHPQCLAHSGDSINTCWKCEWKCNWKGGPAAHHSKAIKVARLVERKICSFWMLAASRDGGLPSKGWLPPPPTVRGESFYRQKEGGTCRDDTAPTVILKLAIGGQSSVILIGLGTINLQFHSWFVPISLRPILRIVAAVWAFCRWPLPPAGSFSIYKTAHRIWLRILSIALEEELKVLDFA